MSPWIGVALIGIGVAADVILSLTRNEVSSIIPSVIVAGVGVVQAFAIARARSNGGASAQNHSTNGR
jgi:hypothetical protein